MKNVIEEIHSDMSTAKWWPYLLRGFGVSKWTLSLVAGQNVEKPKRRQPKRRQPETLGYRNVDRPKRRQTKASTNQNVDIPKHQQTKASIDRNVDRPKRRQTKTSTNRTKPKRRHIKTSTDQKRWYTKRRQTETWTVQLSTLHSRVFVFIILGIHMYGWWDVRYVSVPTTL